MLVVERVDGGRALWHSETTINQRISRWQGELHGQDIDADIGGSADSNSAHAFQSFLETIVMQGIIWAHKRKAAMPTLEQVLSSQAPHFYHRKDNRRSICYRLQGQENNVVDPHLARKGTGFFGNRQRRGKEAHGTTSENPQQKFMGLLAREAGAVIEDGRVAVLENALLQ